MCLKMWEDTNNLIKILHLIKAKIQSDKNIDICIPAILTHLAPGSWTARRVRC